MLVAQQALPITKQLSFLFRYRFRILGVFGHLPVRLRSQGRRRRKGQSGVKRLAPVLLRPVLGRLLRPLLQAEEPRLAELSNDLGFDIKVLLVAS